MKTLRTALLSVCFLFASLVGLAPRLSLADWQIAAVAYVNAVIHFPGTTGLAEFIDLGSSSSTLCIAYGGTTCLWKFDVSSGDLRGDASNGGKLSFARGLQGVQNDQNALAAAGSTQTDAAAIAHVVSVVTGANGTVGVKLPALASMGKGEFVYIINTSTSSALKYYSNASGETIDAQSGTTANSLGAKLWATCLAYDTSNWYCGDSVIPF